MPDPSHLRAKLAKLSRQLGLVTAFAGGLSMFLRALDLSQVTAFLPGFYTACAIFLCGSALAFPQHGLSHAYSRIRQGLAWVALTLAVGSFVFYGLRGLPQEPGQQRWMMAPMTGFVVLMVAAAILCLQRPRTQALAQGLAILGLTSCLLALIGYMLGTMTPADLGTAFPMRIPAALLLLLLSLSVLWARPDVVPMAIITSATPAGSVARRLLLPLLALPILLNFLFHQMTRLDWYGLALEQTLFTFVSMITIAALVWWQVWILYRLGYRQQLLEERARQAQQAEGRYALLVQAVTDYAIYTLDAEGRISNWNADAERLRGFNADEILGHPYAELFPPEAVEAGVPQRLLDTARRDGKAVDEGWLVRKAGTRFYAHTMLSGVKDAEGRLLGFANVTRDMSAQKQAEAEQVKLHSILNTTVDPLLVIDHMGTIETFNPAAERVFGYRAEEVLQRNVNLLMPSPDRERHDQYLHRYRETGEARVIGIGREIMARRKDGSVFPAELSVSEMRVDGRQMFTGIVRDITVRKTAEEAVKRSEERLTLALEAGNIGVWDVDIHTEQVLATGPLFEYLAVPTGIHVDFSAWLRLAHPEDQESMRAQFDQVAHDQRQVVELEHRMRAKDGTWRWLLSRGTVSARDDAGQALRLHGATSDIHQRKMAEVALRQSKLDLEIALQGAAFHLWHFHVPEQRLVDLDGLIEILGYRPSPETEKLSFWVSLLHPDDVAYWCTQPLLPLPKELQENGVELRLRAQDGRWHWLLTRARVLETDSHGAPTLIAGTCVGTTAGKEAAEQLLHAAQHDPLTDLPNRALTYAFGERLLEAALRHGDQCAVLFIDLDRFKPINDTFGHAAGDAVLCAIAQRLQSCVRGEDVVGRIGGDEFLVILAHVQKIEDLNHVATNCLVAVDRPIVYQDLELQVSSSIGISLYPTNGRTMETLVKHADTAMYHAKQYGRHNFQFFTPAMNARAKSLLNLEGRLRRAVEQQAFCLHYQPVVDTQTHRIAGAEALLRWPMETIGPEEFIPLAESSGLILPLGDWILQEACQQQRRWVEQGLAPLRISVNVSPLQFRQPQFCERIARTLSTTGIDPAYLQLEITENAVLQDLDAVVRTLHTLRGMGLSIALDDFGKGYSSLSYLKALPLDTVKVDKDFVLELQTDRVNLAITEAIIRLGDRLGLQVIAEGIETEAVLQLLRTQQCHHMQGFYLSHPLPAEAFAAWCRDPLAPGRAYRH